MVETEPGTKQTNQDAFAELDAMRTVFESLAGLQQASVARVLRWAAEQYGVGSSQRKLPSTAQEVEGAAFRPQEGFSSIADLFAAADPKTGPERALVAAYWFQVLSGQEELDAKAINDELKHMGHRLANVTATLSGLINQRPQLVVQTRKTGKGAQGRKRYRMTHAGIRRVETLLSGRHAEPEQNDG